MVAKTRVAVTPAKKDFTMALAFLAGTSWQVDVRVVRVVKGDVALSLSLESQRSRIKNIAAAAPSSI